MTDQEILDKYIHLEKSWLTEKEKKEVMDMLYKYKVFSLRDNIGTCPNIEVEMDVTDKFPFFIRTYHVKEEDKTLIDKEMKVVVLFRHIKRRVCSPFQSTNVDY